MSKWNMYNPLYYEDPQDPSGFIRKDSLLNVLHAFLAVFYFTTSICITICIIFDRSIWENDKVSFSFYMFLSTISLLEIFYIAIVCGYSVSRFNWLITATSASHGFWLSFPPFHVMLGDIEDYGGIEEFSYGMMWVLIVYGFIVLGIILCIAIMVATCCISEFVIELRRRCCL